MKNNQNEPIFHTLPPLFDERSRVLILGTMPSPVSRARGCYYGHPQNRFWKVLAALFPDDPLPEEADKRHEWALAHGIALWDVLASCRISGADDSSITDPIPNDLSRILDHVPITAIFTTGSKATSLYRKYCLPVTGRASIALPSSSPANCRNYTLEKLIDAYRVIKVYGLNK